MRWSVFPTAAETEKQNNNNNNTVAVSLHYFLYIRMNALTHSPQQQTRGGNIFVFIQNIFSDNSMVEEYR